MADQRSAFRFRLPWLPAASAPRRTMAPRQPAQPTANTTPTPASQRTAETQVPSQPTTNGTPTPAQSTAIPSQPTPTGTPAPAQSTDSSSPAPATERTAGTKVPSQPTSNTTSTPTPQKVDMQTPTQPTTRTATAKLTPQTKEAQQPIQSITAAIPSTTTPQKAEIEAPAPSVATTTPIAGNIQTAQTQPSNQPTAIATTSMNATQSKEAQAPVSSITTAIPSSTAPQKAENEAPGPSVATINPIPAQKAQTETPSQPTAPASPTPPNKKTAENQPSSHLTTIETITNTTTERPPLSPQGVTSTQAPLPQSQESRTESQPSSPYNVKSKSRVSSQPASPSPSTTQSRSSQPSTPSRPASQSRATSLFSTPSQTGAPKSPTLRTPSQSRSQSRKDSRPAGQTPSNSPSSKAAQGQPTTATIIQSTSPSKAEPGLTPKNFQPSSRYSESPSSLLEKEPESTVSEQLQPKPDAPNRSSKPETFQEDSKTEETKEVKDIMQETTEKTYKEARDKNDCLVKRVPGLAGETKEEPSIRFQPQQAELTLDRKEIKEIPASNGKETKTTAQPRNRSISAESCQKLAMTNGEHSPLHKEIREDISKLVQKMAVGDSDHSVNDRPVSVITLAGENRGATMHLGTDSAQRGGAVPIRRGYKVNPDESAETMTDGEGSFRGKSEDATDTEDQGAEEFINSNVQGINNSIMFNSSITERNPGVHLNHSRFPVNLKKSTAETDLLDTEKKGVSRTHAQKLTHQPMVRRRCLEGLFLESSDSDPENTTKPRRHGCRVGRKEKSKDKKDIF
ncbi:hypothetical protein M9H77_24866 [Catharanthus roseus]|uniref:Uncharacterized protein n=1 Tax=Catharanthus roseus TaxID=4058 RepID=A0ACC0A7T5_CATRO|nr:hypothetical protein M9H77_24866 [Catharanthus roseus]